MPARPTASQVGPLLDDLAELVEEPGVDAGGRVETLDADAAAQRGLEMEGPVRGGEGRAAHELVVVEGLEGDLGGVAVQSSAPVLEGAQRLLERFREGAADGHGLPDRLHLRAEYVDRAGELLERPARDLGHDVVDGGLEAGRGAPGDVVGDLVERVADGQAGGDLGDREAGGLRGQRRGAAHPRVHLDHHEVARVGLEGELDVAAAGLDPHPADAGEGGVPHALVLDVGQGLGGGHGDRVAGVDPHRVEVLDGADDDAVVGLVPHDLELVLLPTRDRALDEDLARWGWPRGRRWRCGGSHPSVPAMPVPRPPRM